MKKVLVLALIMLVSLSFAGCNGGTTAPAEAPPEAAPVAAAPEAPVTPAAPVEPVAEEATADSLAGRWYWMGSLYYELAYDGEGTMAGSDIRWTAADGILAICNTPDTCGTTCIAPAEWYYVIEGNELTLTSTIIEGMTFTYTRR